MKEGVLQSSFHLKVGVVQIGSLIQKEFCLNKICQKLEKFNSVHPLIIFIQIRTVITKVILSGFLLGLLATDWRGCKRQ